MQVCGIRLKYVGDNVPKRTLDDGGPTRESAASFQLLTAAPYQYYHR